MLANPFNRPVAFRFYFPKWESGYTVGAKHFADALQEVTLFLAQCGITDPGPMELFINGEPASAAYAAQAA